MFRINDTLGRSKITFNYVQTMGDAKEALAFIRAHKALGMDTESTGLNPFRAGWKFRTFQFGNADTAYVIPAHGRQVIEECWHADVKWIAHNGTHDVRSIDAFLGYTTGVSCSGETYLPAHYADSRKRGEGGIGHALKDLATRYVSYDAGKWETALKKEFKQIEIPVPGEFYKSGFRKGMPKMRKAHIDAGWALIDPTKPAYIAYAAADPILTYRLWEYYRPVVKANGQLYADDLQLQHIADTLYRRAIRLDQDYTRKLSAAFLRRATRLQAVAAEYGCSNINSGAQIAEVLIRMGIELKAKTPSGKWKTDNGLLRELLSANAGSEVAQFIRAVLGAKQMLKRREAYAEAFLRNMDTSGRVAPSINVLGARTGRMSVSNPPLQQLPTKDREEDEHG